MKLGIKVAVSVTLLTIVFLIVPWAEMREALGRLPPLVWVGVLGGFVAGHLAGVLKWRGFVNAGRARLGVRDATLCYSAGLFANLCLPSIVGGDVLRMGLAGRFTRRPEAALFGGVMDRITDVTSLALLTGLGGLLARGRLPGWTGTLLTAALALGVAAAVLAAPLVFRLPLARWPRRLRRSVGRSLVALRRLGREPGTAVLGLSLSVAIQGGFVLLNAWLGRGVGIELPLAVWLLVWPLAKLSGLLPISLGGLAVREASLAALLLPFGVPPARAVVCSLLWQTVLIGGGLLGGLAWAVLARTRRRPIGEPESPLAGSPAPTAAK